MSAPSSVAWRQAARGLTLAGFGTFLLLNTLGVLPWSFWADAAAFWPILIVALGLRLVLEKLAPWGALVSPVVVLGTLSLVALRGPTVLEASGRWRDVRAERRDDAGPWRFHGRFAVARLELDARSLSDDVLVEGRAKGVRTARVDVSRRRDTPRVRVGSRRRHISGLWRRGPNEHWELAVNDRWPLRADLDVAFTSGYVDLTTAAVTRLHLDGAFNDLELRLGRPDTDVRVDIEGAFNDLTLIVPEGVPVVVDAEGPLNTLDERGGGRRGGPGYRIDLDGALNSLEVRAP